MCTITDNLLYDNKSWVAHVKKGINKVSISVGGRKTDFYDTPETRDELHSCRFKYHKLNPLAVTNALIVQVVLRFFDNLRVPSNITVNPGFADNFFAIENGNKTSFYRNYPLDRFVIPYCLKELKLNLNEAEKVIDEIL